MSYDDTIKSSILAEVEAELAGRPFSHLPVGHGARSQPIMQVWR